VYELPARTPEDNSRRWYNKNDYLQFANDRKNTVILIQQLMQSFQLNSEMDIDEYLDPNEYTIRGVEQYIYGKEQICRRKLHMIRHVQSILQQQEEQHQYRKHHMARQQHNAELYFYPKGYHIDEVQYPPLYHQHPVTSDESYLRYASQFCGTKMQHKTMCANRMQHALYVL
jgi:hypothetical protein